MSRMKKWEQLKIPFEKIKDATKDFTKLLGKGGYGWVYEGELPINERHTKVAVKRLNEQFGQGLKEFLTEIDLLSGQQHENLITLVGYCDDGKEKIIVYEHAEHGSLDRYIRCSGTDNPLTWLERLEIVVGAARGLDHLHNHLQNHQVIIHRDIKSSNILLDHKYVAKISDLGLSKSTFSGFDRSTVISQACGTMSYLEPEYIRSGFVSKKSDVYSFGMVLFEVLCGRLSYIRDKDGILLLAEVAREYYENNKLDMLIDPVLREQMSQNSLRKYSAIAYKCLQDRENRPLMDVVKKELEETLQVQLGMEIQHEDLNGSSFKVITRSTTSLQKASLMLEEEFREDEYQRTSSTLTSQTSVPSSSPAATPPPTSPTINVSTRPQQDYYSSEEEYQVQLALALSVSNSESRGDSDSDQIWAAKLLSLGQQSSKNHVPDRGDAAADKLSRQYWDYGLLDYEEKVVDGFYDVYGHSTEIGKMPSLPDLQTDSCNSGFEVIVVNRTIDPALEELLQIAHCIALDCPTAEVNLLVQRLAELVTEQMGGPVRDANIILTRWIERSTELRTSLHTSIYPIGSLKVGLSRHRALLFKVLAESVGITCRLVKGSHYTGVEDDAVNIIKLDNDREFLVDLMAAPGTLIPADIFSASKDSSLKSYIPKSSKLPGFELTGFPSNNSQNIEVQNGSGKEPMILTTNTSDTGGLRVSPAAGKRVLPSNQLDHIPSSAIGSSLYKGGRGPNAVGGGSRMNVNILLYNNNNTTHNSVDDNKSLFTELNPFQIKGSGKALMQSENKNERIKGNQVSGRPPMPLMSKNRHAVNEVPRKEREEYKRVNNDFTTSASTSSDGLKSGGGFNESNNENNAAESEAAWAEWKNYRLSLEVVGNNNGAFPKNNNRLDQEKVHAISEQDVRKTSEYPNNRKSGIHESSTASTPPQIDPVMDDVGDCEIPWEDLVIGERIGLGSYGEVYHADWNGTEVAVKKFLDQDFSGAALAEFRREVRIMQRLRHPNVVLFMGAVTRPPNLSIITEFLPRGSLYRIIHRPHCEIDEKRRIKMALDVAKGMNCLHTSIPTIVHRDLKSPNLLVDEDWNVKVGDFGLSRLKHNTFLSSKSTAGTPEWMAPEVLRNENSNEKCDVYSFGVILWELATLRLPWSGMNPMQVVGAVGFQNRRLDIPKDVDPLVGRIIWECWQTDPNLRPSFAQLTVDLKPLQRLAASPQTDEQDIV